MEKANWPAGLWIAVALAAAGVARGQAEGWDAEGYSRALTARQEGLLAEGIWEEVPELTDGEASMARAWAEFDRQLGALGKQTGGEEEVLLDGAKARMACRRTETGGVRMDFHAWATELIQRPLAMSVDGLPSTGVAADRSAVSNFVAREFLPAGAGAEYSVRIPAEVLSAGDRVVGGHTGRSCPVPFEGALFVEIDDEPYSGALSHETRWVFLREDLGGYAVFYASEPARVERGGGEVPIEAWFGTERHEAAEVTEAEVRAAIRRVAGTTRAVSYDGDAAHSYAILFSGGGDRDSNHTRYWGDMAAVYSTLTKQYGYTKSHIKVLMSDGTSSGADLSYYGSNVSSASHGEFGTSSPLDLDGDGVADVTQTATKANLKSAFSSMASALTADDQLFVFITDHGAVDDTTGLMYLVPWNPGSLADYISPGDFASMCSGLACPTAFAMEFCFSGAFIPKLKAQKNRAIATAANLTTSSAFKPSETHPGFRYMNPWAWHFTAAMRGSYPALSAKPWNGNGTGCAADSNGDGYVSVEEAGEYAKAQVGAAGVYSEKPQVEESAAGVGAAFRFLKKAKESLQTVTFEANGGTCKVTNETYTVGKKYGTLPTPVRQSVADWFYSRSYTFDGWYTSAGGGTEVKATDTVTTAAERTLYAHWTTNAAKQTVTFDANGGTCKETSRIYTVGQAYGSFPTATWAGHDFEGWYTAKTGGTQYTEAMKVGESTGLRLYAQWKANKKPNLSFVGDEGWSDVAFLASAPGSTEPETVFGTNDTVYVNFGYRNSGDADAEYYEFSAWVEDEWGEYVEGSGWWDYPYEALHPGNWFGPYTDADFRVKFAEGTYTVKILLDSGYHLDESDETDNLFSLPFTVGTPDRTELSFGAEGGTQTATFTWNRAMEYGGGVGGDAPWLRVEVESQGRQSDGTYWLTLAFTCEPNVETEERAAYRVETVSGYPYRYSITQAAAPKERANLTFFRREDWASGAFLAAQAGATGPAASFKTTDTVYVNYCYANLGNAPTEPWAVLVDLQDASGASIRRDEYDNDALVNGYYRTITNRVVGTGLAPGTYRVVLTLDWRGEVFENDESDNQCAMSFTVADKEAKTPEIEAFAVDAGNGTCTVRMKGEAGTPYRVERSRELGGTWTKAGASATAGSDGKATLEAPVPGTWGTGFFRVVAE